MTKPSKLAQPGFRCAECGQVLKPPVVGTNCCREALCTTCFTAWVQRGDDLTKCPLCESACTFIQNPAHLLGGLARARREPNKQTSGDTSREKRYRAKEQSFTSDGAPALFRLSTRNFSDVLRTRHLGPICKSATGSPYDLPGATCVLLVSPEWVDAVEDVHKLQKLVLEICHGFGIYIKEASVYEHAGYPGFPDPAVPLNYQALMPHEPAYVIKGIVDCRVSYQTLPLLPSNGKFTRVRNPFPIFDNPVSTASQLTTMRNFAEALISQRPDSLLLLPQTLDEESMEKISYEIASERREGCLQVLETTDTMDRFKEVLNRGLEKSHQLSSQISSSNDLLSSGQVSTAWTNGQPFRSFASSSCSSNNLGGPGECEAPPKQREKWLPPSTKELSQQLENAKREVRDAQSREAQARRQGGYSKSELDNLRAETIAAQRFSAYCLDVHRDALGQGPDGIPLYRVHGRDLCADCIHEVDCSDLDLSDYRDGYTSDELYYPDPRR